MSDGRFVGQESDINQQVNELIDQADELDPIAQRSEFEELLNQIDELVDDSLELLDGSTQKRLNALRTAAEGDEQQIDTNEEILGEDA